MALRSTPEEVEVEVETDHPDNKSLMESFFFTGWPFFILIGPDGTIQARGFFDAFEAAQSFIDKHGVLLTSLLDYSSTKTIWMK